jgi:nitrate/nitrite transporter NarK
VDVAPEGARTAVALLGMAGAPVAAVIVLWTRHAGGLTWVLTAIGYLVFAALLKVVLAQPPRPLVEAPEAPRKRGRKKG